jgi:hypothetical protein
MLTFGQVWGGNIAYTADKSAPILAAVRDFTEYYPDDKAAIIMTAELTQFGAIDMYVRSGYKSYQAQARPESFRHCLAP